jgi:hypothetical protein
MNGAPGLLSVRLRKGAVSAVNGRTGVLELERNPHKEGIVYAKNRLLVEFI